MPTWKRNLFVLCVVQLLTLTGFSAYGSFIAFYVQELGASSFAEATSWMAAFQTGGGIAMMVAAPVWGTLADRYGRKMMLIRATGAGCILAFLMSIAQNPMQLTVIRIAQGAFCGTVSAAMTMVATGTPEEHLGSSMGLMQMVQFISGAIGPVLGGLAADALGYRAVFPLSSALMAISVLLLVVLVRERFVAPKRQAQAERGTVRPRAPAVLTRSSISLLLALATISFAMAVLSPIISLYIQALNPDEPHLATLAGAVSSVAAVTSSLAAVAGGATGRQVGTEGDPVGVQRGDSPHPRAPSFRQQCHAAGLVASHPGRVHRGDHAHDQCARWPGARPLPSVAPSSGSRPACNQAAVR